MFFDFIADCALILAIHLSAFFDFVADCALILAIHISAYFVFVGDCALILVIEVSAVSTRLSNHIGFKCDRGGFSKIRSGGIGSHEAA